MNALLVSAYVYARLGWHVFPVKPNAKVPLTQHGFHDATTDVDQIRKWWRDTPDANLGLRCGQTSGIVVVDIDGPQGAGAIKGISLPRTWTVQTPRGGYHLYFQYDERFHTGAGFLPQVDVRAEGGYVLAQPSTVDGKGYKVVRTEPVAKLGIVPDAFLSTSRPGEKKRLPYQERKGQGDPDWVVEALRGVPAEYRNDTATRLAGYFHQKGLPRETVYAILESYAERCNPPMDTRELRATVDSVERYPVTNGISLDGRNELDYL